MTLPLHLLPGWLAKTGRAVKLLFFDVWKIDSPCGSNMCSAAYADHRPPLSPGWLETAFRDLSPAERALVRRALGNLPLDDSAGSAAELIAATGNGAVRCYALRDAAGRLQAVSLFELQRFADGTLNFHSWATVAVAPAPRPLAESDLPVMEDVARKCGCQSISMVTVRPGLVKRLLQRPGWFVAQIVMRKELAHAD